MQSLFTVTLVVCAASLICTALSSFVSDAGTKKIVNMVLGAFVICSLILPIKSAVASFGADISQYETAEQSTASSDELVNEQVVKQTEENLEQTAMALLEQNGIAAEGCEVVLAETGSGIIISSVSIYMDSGEQYDESEISRIISENFSVSPVISEQSETE